MDLDAKQRLLCAIYVEYQTDIPEMGKNVTAEALKMSEDVFRLAAVKLSNEQLITNLRMYGIDQKEYPCVESLAGVMISPYGIEYVENKLHIDRDSTGKEKVQTFFDKCSESVLSVLTDIAAKAIAEMTKQGMSK